MRRSWGREKVAFRSAKGRSFAERKTTLWLPRSQATIFIPFESRQRAAWGDCLGPHCLAGSGCWSTPGEVLIPCYKPDVSLGNWDAAGLEPDHNHAVQKEGHGCGTTHRQADAIGGVVFQT